MDRWEHIQWLVPGRGNTGERNLHLARAKIHWVMEKLRDGWGGSFRMGGWENILWRIQAGPERRVRIVPMARWQSLQRSMVQRELEQGGVHLS